jgi:hypothetical protein
VAGGEHMSNNPQYDAAVKIFLDDLYLQAYNRGAADGLSVAKKIRCWLTRQPDTKWQATVRKLTDKEIARFESKIKQENTNGNP